MQAWGWRIPFLVGAALAGTVWIARSTMEESPEFHRQRAAGTVPDSPLRHSLAHHRGAIGRAFAISALGSITYYVGITYVPAFLTSAGSLTERDALWLSTAAAVMVILVTPFVGLLSDRIGRKPVLVDARARQHRPADHHVLADGQRLAGPGAARRAGAGRAGRRGQRGRRGRHRRAIPRRRPGHRPGARRDRRDRDLRRADPVARPISGSSAPAGRWRPAR